MRKQIQWDLRASKEVGKFPREVRTEIQALINILKEKGRLQEPESKKLKGRKLFELRVRYRKMIWRVIYAYLDQYNLIMILSGFRKQTQRTLIREIEKAQNRLRQYL